MYSFRYQNGNSSITDTLSVGTLSNYVHVCIVGSAICSCIFSVLFTLFLTGYVRIDKSIKLFLCNFGIVASLLSLVNIVNSIEFMSSSILSEPAVVNSTTLKHPHRFSELFGIELIHLSFMLAICDRIHVITFYRTYDTKQFNKYSMGLLALAWVLALLIVLVAIYTTTNCPICPTVSPIPYVKVEFPTIWAVSQLVPTCTGIPVYYRILQRCRNQLTDCSLNRATDYLIRLRLRKIIESTEAFRIPIYMYSVFAIIAITTPLLTVNLIPTRITRTSQELICSVSMTLFYQLFLISTPIVLASRNFNIRKAIRKLQNKRILPHFMQGIVKHENERAVKYIVPSTSSDQYVSFHTRSRHHPLMMDDPNLRRYTTATPTNGDFEATTATRQQLTTLTTILPPLASLKGQNGTTSNDIL